MVKRTSKSTRHRPGLSAPEQERKLDYWTRKFDAIHLRMQSDKARQAIDALFSADEAELNRSDN